MLYTYVAAILAGLSIGAAGAWQVQQWRMDSHEKDRLAIQVADERELHARESRRSQHVIDAQNNARAREARLRADADNVRAAAGRVLSASQTALARAETSHDACLVTALALDDVFQRCTKAYGDLGAAADRHVSDIQTLIEAYPK